MEKLSIIIPHYNSADLLGKLILSIPRHDEIEVIVVDDNSTKGLRELEALKQNPELENVIFLTNDTSINSAGKCRNIGLEIATGEWVLFADADDFFVDGFYDIVKKYFKSDYDVVLFSPTSIFIDTDEVSDRHLKFEELISDYLNDKSLKNEVKLRYEYGVPWSKLVRRSLIEENNIRFDEIIAMNDIMYSTKVGYYMKKFLATPEIIYSVTRNKGSLTMMMTKEVHDSRINALIRYYDFINEHLPRNERKYLKISSINALMRTYQTGLGLPELLATYKKFRKNKIKTFDKRFLNPMLITRKVLGKIKSSKKERKYYKN